MSVRGSMSSPDLARQIELLKFYPEVMDEHFRLLMVKDTKMLKALIDPSIPRRTGKAAKAFRSTVTGKGIGLQGRVGWWGNDTPWYINIVEYGASAHPIDSFAPRIGKYIRQHPGFSKRGFMEAGFSALKPMIEADMKMAGDAVLKEMEVK